HVREPAAANPAMLLGEGQAQQAELGILRPQTPAPAPRFGEVALALLEGVGVGEQPADAARPQPLLLPQIKVRVPLDAAAAADTPCVLRDAPLGAPQDEGFWCVAFKAYLI